jgi:hypothetical protein
MKLLLSLVAWVAKNFGISLQTKSSTDERSIRNFYVLYIFGKLTQNAFE